jgi:hypothetical protein
MDYDMDHVTLPRSVRAFGTQRFRQVLEEELAEQVAGLGVDYGGDDFGGSANPDSFEVSVLSEKDAGKEIVVDLLVNYEEVGSPGCRDIAFHSNHTVRGKLRINKRTADAAWEESAHKSDWAE